MKYFNEAIESALKAAEMGRGRGRELYQTNPGRYEVLSAYAAGQYEGFENEYINFTNLWAKDVPATVEALREFGVEYITISDTSTELMSILAAFYKETCEVIGMTRINHGLGWNPKAGPAQVNAVLISI